MSSSITPVPVLPSADHSLMGIALHGLSATACLRCIADSISKQQGGWVVTANLDHLRRMVNEPKYRDLCRSASLVVADGVPLIWASAVQGHPLPERIAGSDLIWTLSETAAKEDRSIFLLGGAPGTAVEAAKVLSARYPGLRIAGQYCPTVGFENDETQIEEMRKCLKEARPDIVFVALGSPKQEEWIVRLCSMLPATWWIGVGISFSFVCGRVKRAPLWMQRCGLEWLHRLAQEPTRLFRRYILQDIPFVIVLMAAAVRQRFASRQTLEAQKVWEGDI
ncbi:MAG TPA: WecB/TagA/CpsF family glycosyltransferase [Tepidisphaeraceae bacterium]|nr:WecB/TagA/CpsF family glycosyltransferase [Tepidisphaeraceae bacterium]